MRHHVATSLAVLIALVACGGVGKDTGAPASAGQLQLAITDGAGQRDSVFAMLVTPIAVRAVRTANGRSTPAGNQVINFVVEPGCGRTYADSETTDAQGNTTVRWALGAKLGTCRLEARAIDHVTGQPVAFATTVATATPAAVDTLLVADYGDGFRFFTGTTASVRPLISRAADRYGNTVDHPLLEVFTRFQTRGDSVTFPATEAIDTVMIAAGPRGVWLVLMAVRDLRALRWSLDFTCGPLVGQVDSVGIPIESFRVAGGTIDSVHYPSTIYPTSSYPSAAGKMVYSATATAWHRDGTTVPFRLTRQFQALTSQRPRTIDFAGTIAQQTSVAPIVYSGDAIAWCGQFGASPNPAHTFTMTAR